MAGRPLVIAHRGFSARYPENTLAAIVGAIDAGADMVEVDVQETGDGEVVVFHDVLLRRLCRIPGRISQVTLAQLQRAKPDLPTLSDALTEVRGRIPLLVEMKNVDAAKVARVIEQSRMVDQVIVFSFSMTRMAVVAQASPKIPRFALIGDELSKSSREWPAAVEVDGVGVASRLLKSAADLRRLKERFGKVFVWTVNRKSRMVQLGGWGADGIITNHPERLFGTGEQVIP
jgi:glycerophosphoryl diester phosphodiesterase